MNGYRKEYTIRRAIPTKNSLEVTFPFEVVDKEARSRNMTVEEFIGQYVVIAEFNGGDGVHYTFALANSHLRG